MIKKRICYSFTNLKKCSGGDISKVKVRENQELGRNPSQESYRPTKPRIKGFNSPIVCSTNQPCEDIPSNIVTRWWETDQEYVGATQMAVTETDEINSSIVSLTLSTRDETMSSEA
ncbi:hypothetical protein RRG08_027893 [Elysia crispata]|uniref:Uncharacterized protein n=1 Tax=Elysia crispata TaxID=231223 RepID=A0AAE1A6X4_9GAST|nr:hypothetical protein RRG08_027893 [Elysia crispata]